MILALGLLPFFSTFLGGWAVFRLHQRLHYVMAFAAGVLVALSLCCASGSAASFSTTLAYSSELHAAEIYAMSANGTGVVRLTHDAAPDRWPALSPDGTTLAFARKSGGMWSIFTMRVAYCCRKKSGVHFPIAFQ